MKKKLISLLMVGAMTATLFAGCGSASSDSAESSEPASEPAASEDASAGATAAATDVEPLEIQFSTTYNETETGGEIIQYFIDQVGELSGGAITVSMLWGGTAYDSAAELDAVATGAVDMVALGHMPHIDVLNYLAFPGFAPGGTQAALDYFSTLMFDDPETSALIQGEAEENGIKYLNIIAGGANAFCATYEFTDLQSLIDGCNSFGNTDAAIFEYLGFQVTSVTPGDVYASLDNGLCNATQMSLAPMVSMGWQEVADYWAFDGTYACGNPFTVNLDWWNSLSAAQQEVIQEAADLTEDYSAGLYDDAIEENVAEVEAVTGTEFVTFSDEDIARMWEACFEAKADSAMQYAEENGKTEGMITILNKAAEITGYDWTAPQ